MIEITCSLETTLILADQLFGTCNLGSLPVTIGDIFHRLTFHNKFDHGMQFRIEESLRDCATSAALTFFVTSAENRRVFISIIFSDAFRHGILALRD